LGLHALGTLPLYIAGVSVVGACFGGFLTLYPALTADFFGTRHYGINYGLVYSAYGVGGFCGPWLGARLMRAVAKVPYETLDGVGGAVRHVFTACDYRAGFTVTGGACLLAAGLVLALPRPARQPEKGRRR
jgi:OFA family oxalate/formate antiporter-like MFS transporter